MKEPVLFKNANELLKQSSFHVAETAKRDERKRLFREWGEHGTEAATFDLTADENSDFEYVLFQNHAKTSETVGRIVLQAKRGAKIRLILVQYGSTKSQLQIEARCDGEGSEIEIRGLQDARATQKLSMDFHSLHAVPHTKSDLQVWCVARDQSQSIFNGLMTIAHGAHHTEAYQKNKNLLLSPKAVIDTFPKLFIANDDVKAAHGSSTSTLNPDQFIYLQSRGIDRDEAERMLTQGFIRQALAGISDESIQTRILDAMEVGHE